MNTEKSIKVQEIKEKGRGIEWKEERTETLTVMLIKLDCLNLWLREVIYTRIRNQPCSSIIVCVCGYVWWWGMPLVKHVLSIREEEKSSVCRCGVFDRALLHYNAIELYLSVWHSLPFSPYSPHSLSDCEFILQILVSCVRHLTTLYWSPASIWQKQFYWIVMDLHFKDRLLSNFGLVLVFLDMFTDFL